MGLGKICVVSNMIEKTEMNEAIVGHADAPRSIHPPTTPRSIKNARSVVPNRRAPTPWENQAHWETFCDAAAV